MRKINLILVTLIIAFLAIASPILCFKAASVQADVCEVQEELECSRRGDTRQAYLDYDI